MDISEFVSQVFIHGVPYEEATRYGAEAVPTLLAMLENPAHEDHWPNIAVVLGMIGGDAAVEPLIRFIEGSSGGVASEAPSREHYRARTSAMMAMGFLVNRTGNQRALTYLIESANPDTWAQRSVRGMAPFQASQAERDADLSKHAILGLALSGRPEAEQTLRSLQQPSGTGTAAQRTFQASVADVVSEALNEHQKIARQGLEAYYRTQH